MVDKQRKPLLEKLEPTHRPLIGNSTRKGWNKEAKAWSKDLREFLKDIFGWIMS